MKKVLFILFVIAIACTLPAMGQSDILGPHNVSGHGCASCHAPHTGAKGNGGANAASGEEYLWGRDFVATTYTLNGGTDTLTISNSGAITDQTFHTAACLSCHDGSISIAGMTGTSYEAIPGGFHVPTYLNDGAESLKNDHPVDVAYVPGGYNWPGTVNADGSITWANNDNATNQFQASYGRPFRLYAATSGRDGVGSYVECSTCHNPHAMQYAKSKFQGSSQVKPSAFFVRGWYDLNNSGSNSTQQFCRSCHYSKSNEYMGITVPTT
jgi:hypothetical protein